MKNTSVLRIIPEVIARAPRHLGINIEIQDYADQVNLWDWIADSGVCVARTFHPEVNLRRTPVKDTAWKDSRADFDSFRKSVLDNPLEGGIQWPNYRFDETVRWMGVPDQIAAKLTGIGVQPLYSLGYGTAYFPRPLVKDLRFTGIPGDDQIDWGAATSAYEYYFAVIYHFRANFGAQYFMMINEPENRWDFFHKPPELLNYSSRDFWTRLFWSENETDQSCGKLYLETLSTQYAVLARLARLAIDDIAGLVACKAGGKMLLSGPTTVAWELFWRKAGNYLDILDYHHYHSESESFRQNFPVAAAHAAHFGKALGVSEFNRYSGGTDLSRNLFQLDNSLAWSQMLMTVLSLARPSDPVVEFACPYLLHYPSTHRNYKHLLYGDMNTVDWSGKDTGLWNRTDEWYPTAEEMQIRFATPAYHMFRMFTRCMKGAQCVPGSLLRSGITNPSSSGPEDFYWWLHVLAFDTGDKLIVTILNTEPKPAHSLHIDCRLPQRTFASAITRVTSARCNDRVIAEQQLERSLLTIDIAPQSLTQIILVPWSSADIRGVRLIESTATPGTLRDLAVYQTTRLRLLATFTDGTEVDLSDVNTLWTSSDPDCVRVEQGGLVQRLRRSGNKAIITASLPGFSISSESIAPVSGDRDLS